jgi:hypothetical protein
MFVGALAAVGLCFIGVMLLRRDEPPAYDDDGRARLPIAMSSQEAEDYLRRLKYPHVKATNGGRLVIAQDSYCSTDDECRKRMPKLVFDFSEGLERAHCITVTHSYNLDWRKIAGKIAGIDGDKLPGYEAGYRKPVRTPVGEVNIVMMSLMHLAVGPGC